MRTFPLCSIQDRVTRQTSSTLLNSTLQYCDRKVLQLQTDEAFEGRDAVFQFFPQWKRSQSAAAASDSTQEADTLILINIFMDHRAERGSESDVQRNPSAPFEPVKVGLI